MEKTPDHLKHAALTERIIKIFYLNFGEKPDFKRQVFDNDRKKTNSAADMRG